MAKRKPASTEVIDHAPIEGPSTALVSEPGKALDISFSPTLAEIAAMKERYAPLKADTPEGYEAVKEALRVLVPLRTSVDARRLQLGDHLRDQLKVVNSTGNRVIELLKEIEAPLRESKKAADEAEERDALAKAQAIEAEQRAAEEQRMALLKAEEDRKKAEAEAELKARQAAIDKEREEFEKQKRAFEQQQQELRDAQEKLRLELDRQQREAQARADQERRDCEHKERMEREECERKDRLVAEKKLEEERKAQAERDRIANEKRIEDAKKAAAELAVKNEQARVAREAESARLKAEKERKAAEKKASQAPDKVKLAKWAAGVMDSVDDVCEVKTAEFKAIHSSARVAIVASIKILKAAVEKAGE